MIYVLVVGIGDMSAAVNSVMRQKVNKGMIIAKDSFEDRKYAAKNIWDAIKETDYIKKEDVICILDGDDELKGENALSYIKTAYQEPDCWLTYGSYDRISGSKATFNGMYFPGNIRKKRWHGSHLKTFRRGLWDHLPDSALKDPMGNWLKTTSDVAIMLPLIEMAGIDRTRRIKETIYRYNDMNPINDHKVNAIGQLTMDKWIRSQEPFKRLDRL